MMQEELDPERKQQVLREQKQQEVQEATQQRRLALQRAHEATAAAQRANAEVIAASEHLNRAQGRPSGMAQIPRFSPQQMEEKKQAAAKAKEAEEKQKELEAYRQRRADRTVTGVKRGQSFVRGSGNRKKKRSKGPKHCWGYNFKGCIKEDCTFTHEWSQEVFDDYVNFLRRNKKLDDAINNWTARGEQAVEAESALLTLWKAEKAGQALPAIDNAIENDQDGAYEPEERSKSKEEQIEECRQSTEENIQMQLDQLAKKLTTKELTAWQYETQADAVRAEEERIMGLAIKEIEEEFDKRTRRCYQHYQRDHVADEQKATPQYHHKYERVGPGEMGPFTRVINSDNREGIKILIKGLLEDLHTNYIDSHTPGAFNCAMCLRSLEIPLSQRISSTIVACRVCLGTLYCSSLCRNWHRYMHQFSCSMHPGWLLPDEACQDVEPEYVEQGDEQVEPAAPAKFDLQVGQAIRAPPNYCDEEALQRPPPLPGQSQAEPSGHAPMQDQEDLTTEEAIVQA